MELEIRDLAAEELAAAGGVAGRALSDNPTFRWAAGDQPVPRIGSALDVFVGFMEGMTAPQLGAFLGRHVVGVAGAAPPGTCVGHVAPPEWRTLPSEVGLPGDDSRTGFVWALFATHDVDERHWHIGPVSVEPGLQGQGIGGALLRPLCARMDAEGEVAWLETDKPDNVAFYRRHGFDVAEEVETHGLTTWFMRRPPR
jgi:ribosomal protein S18 acetylase RimI-like enzyme